MSYCRCGVKLEPMSDELEADLRADGWDDDEIAVCRSLCLRCLDVDLYLEEAMGKIIGDSPSGQLN